VWIVAFYLAINFMLGCRKYAKVGKSLTFLIATQTMYLWIVSLVFIPIPGIYKLHILWIVPVIFLGLFSYYMQGTFPVAFFTWIFMKIILLGTHSPLEKNKIVLAPPHNIFHTPMIAVLKADWDIIKSKILRNKNA
jgi:hypothetical protein